MAIFVSPILKGFVFGFFAILYYLLSKIVDIKKYLFLKNADILFLLISFMFLDWTYLISVFVFGIVFASIYYLFSKKNVFGFFPFLVIGALVVDILFLLYA